MYLQGMKGLMHFLFGVNDNDDLINAVKVCRVGLCGVSSGAVRAQSPCLSIMVCCRFSENSIFCTFALTVLENQQTRCHRRLSNGCRMNHVRFRPGYKADGHSRSPLRSSPVQFDLCFRRRSNPSAGPPIVLVTPLCIVKSHRRLGRQAHKLAVV